MGWTRRIALVACVSLTACGGDSVTSCAGFDTPNRGNKSSCSAASSATEFVECLKGSGYAGRWSIDVDGLPVYELDVEERCDPAGQHDSVFERGPVHLIGNGRGLMAVAHASGAVEVFSTDRGHKWLNHVDEWEDPEGEEHPLQVGGGWSYIVDDDKVLSTRHADLIIGKEADEQVRRLGVGYYETVTRLGDFVVQRRVFAPDLDTRAVVAEVSVSNLSQSRQTLGLVEMWDVNLHQLSGAFADDLSIDNLEEIERRRRQLQGEFQQTASWSPDDRIAVVSTEAKQLPDGIERPGDLSRVDYFPDPVFLAVVDQGAAPDAAWLTDDEVWGGNKNRRKPGTFNDAGDTAARSVDLDGAEQSAVLAVRVPLELPPGTTVTRRFAFGTIAAEQTPELAAEALRSVSSELRDKAVERWTNQLVYAAFPDKTDSGAIQRELAWSSYYLQAAAGYDRQLGARVVSQAGALRFFYGVEGPPGDIALLGETLALIDPELSRDTLRFALGSQHGTESATQARFPYGDIGIGDYVDVLGQAQRSDAYFLVPAALAQYLAFTRDLDFLQEPVGYWPQVLRETGSVARHLEDILNYINGPLGRGAHGLVAMGSGDYTDGLLDESSTLATASGTSSTVNALIVALRFDVLADILMPLGGGLSDGYGALWTEQVGQIGSEAFSGSLYYRGFADNGSPLLGELVFALPQALAILSRVAVGDDARSLLDLFEGDLATDFGVAADTGLATEGAIAQLGHVRPSISAWVAQAAARADSERGWERFLDTLAYRRVELYPNLWYGIWTGPESYVGSGDRAGQAGRTVNTAFGDSPGLNTHVHAAPIRGLMGVLGLSPTADGIRIAPRVPGETFDVAFPSLSLQGTPTSISGSVLVPGSEPMVLEIIVPSGLRATALSVHVNGQGVGDFLQDGSEIRVELPVTPGLPVTFAVEAN